jgi:hypothetical protein
MHPLSVACYIDGLRWGHIVHMVKMSLMLALLLAVIQVAWFNDGIESNEEGEDEGLKEGKKVTQLQQI